MNSMTRRSFFAMTSIAMLGALSGCTDGGEGGSGFADSSGTAPDTLVLDDKAWSHDADNDVYWQVGLVYCAKPAADAYESLGMYVPGAYFDAEDNGDGTYTCTVNAEGEVNGLTATEAPLVMPINTAGYSAQTAPTGYDYGSVSSYLSEGFIYVQAGCRGRDNGYDDGNLLFSGGAPWGVTDLKAAVRYLRYNAALIPGNVNAIFTFGHSGGGAQSALMGATGDSELYEPYLSSIGALMSDDAGANLSDAVNGSMCWCPITCLDQADAAYEWMMGQYAVSGTRAEGTWTQALSKDLAQEYAAYINDLGLYGNDGKLTLESSDSDIFAGGTYYDYLHATIEESLNNFLSDTTFPYTSGGQTMADGGFGGGLGGGVPEGTLPSGEAPSGDAPSGDMSGGDMPSGDAPNGELPSGDVPSGDMPSGELPNGEESDGASTENGGMQGGQTPDDAGSAQVTYETVQDYIAALNEDGEWVVYDEQSNTASITSVGAFVTQCKNPSKDVGAFDSLDRGQAENTLFGVDESDALHFDATMAELLQENAEKYAQLSNWDEAYVDAYRTDREKTDVLGKDMDTRVSMYNPLYYLCSFYGGEGTSTVAPHWRVHSGVDQGDTSLTTEMNLALALEECEQVSDVEFATVWGQGHTTAERTGDSTANFIAWVKDCL